MSSIGKTGIVLILSSLGLAGLAACGGGSAPKELLTARSAFDEAQKGPAAQLDPADLAAAKKALDTAEQSYAARGDATETRDLAYAAQRRVVLAETGAQERQASIDKGHAMAQIESTRAQQLQVTSAELGQTRDKLQETEKQMAAVSQALQNIATVKNDSRGMVITLSGSVIFASGKSTLLPEAKKKLADVADALSKQDKSSKIVVDGFTDSTGSDELNQRLSRERAEAVRSFLMDHGIAADRMTAEGMGSANPVADNTSPEGRANNRRVEIVVQRNGMGTTNPSTP